jgi:hypothetical protein
MRNNGAEESSQPPARRATEFKRISDGSSAGGARGPPPREVLLAVGVNPFDRRALGVPLGLGLVVGSASDSKSTGSPYTTMVDHCQGGRQQGNKPRRAERAEGEVRVTVRGAERWVQLWARPWLLLWENRRGCGVHVVNRFIQADSLSNLAFY